MMMMIHHGVLHCLHTNSITYSYVRY